MHTHKHTHPEQRALQVQAPITAAMLLTPFYSARLSQPEWKQGPEGEPTRVGRTKPAQMPLVCFKPETLLRFPNLL